MIENISQQELDNIAKAMILSTIEAIIKHNNKAAELIRDGVVDKEEVATYRKKLMNLIHIIYPQLDKAYEIVRSEHPEYIFILDFVKRTYEENDGD